MVGVVGGNAACGGGDQPAAAGDARKVYVRRVDGSMLAVSVRASDTVQALVAPLEAAEAAPGRAGARTTPGPRAARRLVHGGAVLRNAQRTLEDYGVLSGSTVLELHGLRGGGGDGGTTAAQRKFMDHAQMKKKDTARDLSEEQRARFAHCAASGQPLCEPIVACELGFLYSKEQVVKQLVTKTLHENLSHLRKLKDLYTLNLEPSRDGSTADRFMCPITMRPANGKTPFVFVKGCGHVVSEQALKQVGGAVCVVCSSPYAKEDVVPLHPPKELREQRRAALEAARAAEKAARAAGDHDAKRGKKDAKEKRSAAVGADEMEAKGKKPRLEVFLAGTAAGSKVGGVNSAALGNTISKAASSGTAASVAQAKQDPVYASMFKRDNGETAKTEAHPAWGHGAMAGVMGGR